MSDDALKSTACKIRRAILNSTSHAGSGHPTSSLSAVELMTVLFFDEFFKQDRDRFVLSKGHAAPLLYSIYYALGKVSEEELMSLRQLGSNLEGHPTPRFTYADVATGSLGQGLSIGLGMTLAMRLQKSEDKVFVLLGDSEMAEGQVWEAMELASHYKTNNLIAIVDVNRLGQRGETMLGWDLETYRKRAEAFGWETFTIENGHDIPSIVNTYTKAMGVEKEGRPQQRAVLASTGGEDNLRQDPSLFKPKIIFAKTVKGKGVSFLENKNGWHGKTLGPDELKSALAEINKTKILLDSVSNSFTPSAPDVRAVGTLSSRHLATDEKLLDIQEKLKKLAGVEPEGLLQAHSSYEHLREGQARQAPLVRYKIGELISTRKAYGQALSEIGNENQKVIALDAEVSNSTYADLFAKEFPQRFFEMFIAEQNMISVGVGLSTFEYIPFVSTFGAFLTRAFDQIRMAAYSQANIKLVGSHVGVSIGQDGPSQMGLEDIGMIRSIQNSTILYPSDAVSTRKLVKEMSVHNGIDYLRTTRMETPVIYNETEEFPIGSLKILKHSTKDVAVVVGAGITLHEALRAYEELKKKNIYITVVDLYSVKPLDKKRLLELAKKTKRFIVVEDHYIAGGIGEAVMSCLVNEPVKIDQLAVHKIPRSGKPDELLRFEEIDSKAIISAVEKEVAYASKLPQP